MTIKKSPTTVYWLKNNLYLNVTNICSNNCYFCLRNFKDGVGGFNLKLQKEPTLNEILYELQEVLNKRNWREIVFCGFGEPLARLDYVLEVCKWIKSYYGKIVALRVNTNGQGYLLNKGRRVLEELKEAGINKLSVSLNASDKETYRQVCRPMFENAFESVLEFIDKGKKMFEMEISAVAIPEISLEKIKELAQKMGVNLRVRDYIHCFW